MATRQVLFQRTVQTSPRPGAPPPVIFKTRGGTVLFDGYPFTLNVNGQRAHLNVGDHVLLFGRYDKLDGKWVFGDRDVFRMDGSIVINTLPKFDRHPEGLQPRMPIDEFAQRVRALIQ